MERKKITFDSFIRAVILGAIIIGVLMLLKRLSGVLLPFFLAWLIAYLIYPLVSFFQHKLRLKKQNNIYLLCLVYSQRYRKCCILSACAAHDSGIPAGKGFIDRILQHHSYSKQCPHYPLRIYPAEYRPSHLRANVQPGEYIGCP